MYVASEVTIVVQQETYCNLIEGVYHSLLEFDQRLQQTLKSYHHEINSALMMPLANREYGSSGRPTVPEKAELRDRQAYIPTPQLSQ